MIRCCLAGLFVACALVATPMISHADRARAKLYVEQGKRRAAVGDLKGALARYEAAVAADAHYLHVYPLVVPLWVRAGKFTAIIQSLERVTLRQPNYAYGWYALAYAYRRTNRPRTAIAAYEAYIPLRPDDASPLFGMAMAYKQVGDRARAVATFRRYIKAETNAARARFVKQARAEVAALLAPPPPDPMDVDLGRARQLLQVSRAAIGLAARDRSRRGRASRLADRYLMRAHVRTPSALAARLRLSWFMLHAPTATAAW